MKKIVGFEGELIFDDPKLDGTQKKLLDVSKINNLGWIHSKNLEEGICETLNWLKKIILNFLTICYKT